MPAFTPESSIEIERMPNGNVRIVHVLAVLDEDAWTHLFAALSQRGETQETTRQALELHRGELRDAAATQEGAGR